ncbi:hypothetical protein SFRURICE_000007 [Spodoptera frugiperda]|nr:hypothetical protein SFRURICE_000007 [Spodoptera frugiperda]
MVLVEQISALMDFLENHQDLALGHCSRTNEGRSLMRRYWMECAQILNAVSVDCPNKTPAEWRSFYNEYKSKLLKKIKSQKCELSATGGGPAKKIILTPLQERLYNILGRDVGEPLQGVRHNPLSLFIILDQEKETVAEPSTSNQPPKRRKRQQSTRRNAAEDTADHAALEAAQSRLEAIEARNAEATLKTAEAINNLAAAISRQSSTTEKVVELLDRFVTSVSKKVITYC